MSWLTLRKTENPSSKGMEISTLLHTCSPGTQQSYRDVYRLQGPRNPTVQALVLPHSIRKTFPCSSGPAAWTPPMFGWVIQELQIGKWLKCKLWIKESCYHYLTSTCTWASQVVRRVKNFHLAWLPKFNFQDPYDRRTERNYAHCPLTFTGILQHKLPPPTPKILSR